MNIFEFMENTFYDFRWKKVFLCTNDFISLLFAVSVRCVRCTSAVHIDIYMLICCRWDYFNFEFRCQTIGTYRTQRKTIYVYVVGWLKQSKQKHWSPFFHIHFKYNTVNFCCDIICHKWPNAKTLSKYSKLSLVLRKRHTNNDVTTWQHRFCYTKELIWGHSCGKKYDKNNVCNVGKQNKIPELRKEENIWLWKNSRQQAAHCIAQNIEKLYKGKRERRTVLYFLGTEETISWNLR